MPKKHTIKDGDSITSIAEIYGLFEETIWMHADNAKLRDKRPNKNILSPGDAIVIPDKEIHQESCAAETKHKFRRKGVPAKFRVQLFEQSEPRANQSYRFDIDGKIHEGTTDGNGLLEETVSPSVIKGVLIIGPDEEKIEFQFGTLEPVEEIRGTAQRLANMGLFHGDLDVTADDPLLSEAIAEFQQKNSLPVTGEMDDATTNTLMDCHDV